MRSLILVALVAVSSFPTLAVPQDGGWDDGQPPPAWSDVQPAAGYDVSVDLDVQGGVTVETFHGALAPYGQWVVVGNHGRVWRPNVPAGWRPYYYGRWEWTNEGWLWVSDEPWGWAAYHYGRWSYDPYYGWIWVPGTEWAPAWVAWRTSGDVIGWAPLAPGYSVYVSSYPFVDFWWTFVPCVRFVSVPIYTVAYAPSFARRHFHATAPAPARPPRGGRVAAAPAPAWGGPAPRLIEQRVGRPISPARIVAAPAPGAPARQGEIAVYRPDARGSGGRPGPSRGEGRGTGAVTAPGWPGGGRGERGAAIAPEPPRGAVRGPEQRGGAVGAPGPRGGTLRAPPEQRGSPARAPEQRGGAVRGPEQRGAGPSGAEPRGGGAPAPRGSGGGHGERGGRR